MSAPRSKKPPGVAEFFTPCLVLAATVATVLSQLGLPVGGFPFTIALYLVFDFVSFRWGRKVPPLQRLRASFSVPSGSTLTAASGADKGARVAAQSQPTLVTERRVRTETSPSAKASPPAPSSAAQSKGLRMSMQGRTDIFANAESPIEFENDFFKGRMLFLLKCSPPDPKWDSHFEGKNRMFEMQIQGKLKLLPKGEVYMGGELDERPKQGLVTQTVSKIVMGFAKQMVKSLHYSFGERRPPSDPLEAESPHVTFPLYRVMDWFVVTPEAEAPPSLGGDVVELPEERAARRGGRSPDIEWRTDVTYTMCFHSNTVNFQEWSVINVPGQGSLDLDTFLCKQPVSVVVYDFTAANASAAHKARDKSYMFRCTLSNESPGHVARPVVCESPSKMASMSRSDRAAGVDCLEGDESDDCGMSADREGRESTVVGVASSDDQTDHDGGSSLRRLLLSLDGTGASTRTSSVVAPSVASEGSSPRKSYYVPVFPTPEDKEASGKGLVKSDDILPLLMDGGDVPATSQNAHHDPATNVAFLGEGSSGGVTMLKGNAMPAGVQVVKVGGGESTFRSDFFYGGDVVVLQHSVSRKFVRIGRAWVLAWSSKASASKIHFVIKGVDSRRPLAYGQAFSLASRRWSDWEVGVSRQPSSKQGGWSLGCFNMGKRRNVTRLSLLTLVARPWFDPVADLAGGQGRGVIPALELEEDAITVSYRGLFEDPASAEEDDDDDDDGSDPAKSEADDGISESDPECCSDADKVETERRLASYRSFSEDGLSSKAARAMSCYPDEVSSLQVGIPAWVEFFHRERRQGLLAFVVAVHGVPHSLPLSPSTPTKTATDSSKTTITTSETGDNSVGSPARATRTPAWTCLRTGIELSRSVDAYRECIGPSQLSGSWQSKAPPRVFQHMGKGDQSVRLINHEISEIQRWEASFRSKGKPESPPAILDPSSSPSAQDYNSLALSPKDDKSTSPSSTTGEGGGRSDGSILEPSGSSSSPGGRSSIGDGDLASSPRLQRSPKRLAGSSGTELQASSAASALPYGASVVHHPARSGASGGPSAACLPKGEQEGGRGKGLTAPYRLLCEAVSVPGELDHHFLSGSSAADLGVTVEGSSGTPTLGSAVARCLSESHWREEWAVLFPSHVACYPALSTKPSWVLPLKTLFKVSSVSDERCPFPGLRGLRLETIGRAHYLCFANCSSRDNWLSEILRLSKGGTVDPPSALELHQDHRETYVLKTTHSRAPARLILNARRPGFDIPDGVFKQGNRPGESDAGTSLQDGSSPQHQQQQPWQLSAEVLRSAFAVSADPGNEQLVPFLDLASTFRKVDLSSLDLDSDEALCFFANLYHLLVRHMLLVLGAPPSAKEWPVNYVQVSYEVGGDVFSLQELEHCVLRGRLPRPNLKDLPKRFAPLPPETDDHYFYSLAKADDRMSLFLNNGSQSNPSAVVLLTPGAMNEQLNRACQAFVDHTVKTDPKRRQILVHKAFQLYAKDLNPHGTSKDMVRYGLRFAGRSVVQALSILDVDISQAHIRYHPYLLKCHENMTLLDVPAAADAPA